MKISEHCYALTGLCDVPPWMANAGLVVGNTKTLVVDTGINQLSAQTIFGYACAVKPENQMLVVNTERHIDHIGGNAFFAARNVDIYGHYQIQRTAQRNAQGLAATEEDYNSCITNPIRRDAFEATVFFTETSIVNPNHLIQENNQFDLGDLEVQILLTPGHTPTNISLFVPSDNVLFCSDCIVTSYLPNLEDGTSADWQAWLDSLELLEALAPTIVVPGHGQILQGQQIKDEWERTREILNTAIKTGRAPTQ